ncbi:MAG: 1-acyl-sn-glycerol-3-phosphate acyltransferase [Armatimonadetes bacterium]|nr:1-acyl-sn-glycerol-3-phosphate acyltransferase [Armatimonadota bacterium]
MLYWIGRFLSRLICGTMGRLKIVGAKNVPVNGPVILAPNHVSYIDPPTVGAACSRQVHFMAKQELFEIPVLGFLIRGVGAFPVRQNTADRRAIKRALDLLSDGKVICIFPEGTRSPDGKLMEAEAGIGMIALKSRAPVLPVALIDTDALLPRHSIRFHFARVRVVFGERITFDDLYDRGMDRDAIEEVGHRVMAEIARLKGDGDFRF